VESLAVDLKSPWSRPVDLAEDLHSPLTTVLDGAAPAG
jgi:hypothetical protein